MKESVLTRRSRRTFLETDIDGEKLRDLCQVIDRVNGQGGLSLRLVEEGGQIFTDSGQNYGCGVFVGVRALIALAGPEDDPHLMEKCGYYGEQVLLRAVELGLGTCWVGVDYDYAKNPLELEPGDRFALFIVLGNVPDEIPVLEQRFWDMSHSDDKAPEDFFDCDLPEAPDWLIDGATCVSRAPSALNAQKPFFTYRDGVLSAHVSDEDAFIMDHVDLGIAKYHFELGAGGRFELGNPGVYHPER